MPDRDSMPDPAAVRLPAPSRRKAMDWSLVLASQAIPHHIASPDPTGSWHLLIASADVSRASRAIRQYEAENRPRPWQQPYLEGRLLFDWMALIWAVMLTVIHAISESRPAVVSVGVMQGLDVSNGQWWRLVTATQLHADWGHLASNLSIGLVLLGLVMGRWGTATGMLAALLAGVAGNAANWLLHPERTSLGASGVVMGCIGLLALFPQTGPAAARTIWRGLLGGLGGAVMLFMILGLDPRSDVLAHAGGFVAGLGLAMLLRSFPRLAHAPAASRLAALALILMVILPWKSALSQAAAPPGGDMRGRQFTGWSSFTAFTSVTNDGSGSIEMSSPIVTNAFAWNELITSWNAVLPVDGWMKIEARAFLHPGATRYYTLGLWSGDPATHPRTSVARQDDDDAAVRTDTLVLSRPAEAFQLRVTLGPTTNTLRLKFLAACVANTTVANEPLPPNPNAWGKTLVVPEISQMPYENGKTWCSPATVAMLLAFWAHELNRPELAKTVPEIAWNVHDNAWTGTGNWSFNMAYAGSLPGLRACVTRFSDIAEIEEWVAAGIPVGLSVCYNRLRGKSDEPSGHLVVCVGFTKTGDPIVNDPGTTLGVQKTFPRANLERAWAYSKNTVYLVYPETYKLAFGKTGHWKLFSE